MKSTSFPKFRIRTLPVEFLFYALATVFAASVQAMDAGYPIRLALGESSTTFSAGTVVVTESGYVRGDDGVFPAISSDHRQIAIIHVEDPHDPTVSLAIISIERRSVIEQFLLVPANAGGGGSNSETLHIALEEDEIRDNLEYANRYLSQNEFHPVPELYNIRDVFTGYHYSQDGGEHPRIRGSEVGAWEVSYDRVAEKLEIVEKKTGKLALSVKRAIEVYGITSPGVLCRVRPAPYRGWHDEESGTLIIGLGYFWGGHGCDVSDRWLIETLGSS